MKEKEKAPAFQWYPKDFLASSKVQAMSLAQKGAYVLLLGFQWLDGSIPSDLGKLARLCGVGDRDMTRLWPEIAVCFEPMSDHPGRLQNARLEQIRAGQKAFRESRKKGGKKGAAARWKHDSEMAEPSVSNGSAIVLPSKSDGLATVQSMANDSSAVCSLHSASAKESPKAGSLGAPPPAKQPIPTTPDEWERDPLWLAVNRIYAAASPAMQRCGPERARRAVHAAMANGSLRHDDAPVRPGIDSRTVSEVCDALLLWGASPGYTENGGKYALMLCNWLDEKRHLAPPPEPAALAAGTTSQHLQAAQDFDREAGL